MGEAKRRKSILGDAYGQPVSSVFPKSTNWTSNDWAIYLAGADWKARQQLGPGALVFLENDELLLKYLYLDSDSLLDLTLSQSDEFMAGLKQRLILCASDTKTRFPVMLFRKVLGQPTARFYTPTFTVSGTTEQAYYEIVDIFTDLAYDWIEQDLYNIVSPSTQTSFIHFLEQGIGVAEGLSLGAKKQAMMTAAGVFSIRLSSGKESLPLDRLKFWRSVAFWQTFVSARCFELSSRFQGVEGLESATVTFEQNLADYQQSIRNRPEELLVHTETQVHFNHLIKNDEDYIAALLALIVQEFETASYTIAPEFIERNSGAVRQKLERFVKGLKNFKLQRLLVYEVANFLRSEPVNSDTLEKLFWFGAFKHSVMTAQMTDDEREQFADVIREAVKRESVANAQRNSDSRNPITLVLAKIVLEDVFRHIVLTDWESALEKIDLMAR